MDEYLYNALEQIDAAATFTSTRAGAPATPTA
jgi:hypothetical protein